MTQHRLRPSRRTFLTGVGAAAAVAAAGVGAIELWPSSASDQAVAPVGHGTLDDVEHVVILMQENRSFDQYYGTMRGVRGFGDPTALTLDSRRSVLYQPTPTRTDGGYLLPFHVDTRKVDGQDMGDLAHDWNTTHVAWGDGRYDQWTPAKSEMTMGYFTESDIPFQRALAAAFTICDAYHCSIQGPTTPNRLYLWTGTIDPAGAAGGPATANPPDYQPVYHWTTYPERLQKAGISWQVYANDEVGDSADSTESYVGDYGDNPLWLFQQYHDALASTDAKIHQLAERASLRTTWKPDSGLGKNVDHVIAQFTADCKAGTLPAVSWVVAPYRYSEHPAARPVDGAAYTQGVLNAVWSNPALWAKTVVLINYDENDGFYDHVPPPVPPPGTAGEFLPATQPEFGAGTPASGAPTPIGLGPRVPMTVISPWSHGGWVNSQVYDHTSVLRFLETWTGVREPNISAWRRQICGDLTGCFDFSESTRTIVSLPDTAALRAVADQTASNLPAPAPPPSGQQVVPRQDGGQVPARAVPYQPVANFAVVGAKVQVALANQGGAAYPFAIHVRHPPGNAVSTASTTSTVSAVDVAPGGSAATVVPLDAVTGAYAIDVHGPNGFLAQASGSARANQGAIDVQLALAGAAGHPTLQLTATNPGPGEQTLQVTGLTGLNSPATAITLAPGARHQASLDPLATDHGWYDISVAVAATVGYARRFAGHLENGRPSQTR